MQQLTVDAVNSGKIRLEFGNPEHIRLVKESLIPDDGLDEYEVEFEIWDSIKIKVRAADKLEAEEIAGEEIDLDSFDIRTTVKKI